MQVKLLRVIEDGKVTRVGIVTPRAIDVGFGWWAHRDLEQETGHGTFRSGLFFRLNGFTIAVPPLRERQDEIAGLAATFAAQALGDKTRRVPDIAPDALALLLRYGWPG